MVGDMGMDLFSHLEKEFLSLYSGLSTHFKVAADERENKGSNFT